MQDILRYEVWFEFRHSKQYSNQENIFSNGEHGCIHYFKIIGVEIMLSARNKTSKVCRMKVVSDRFNR